MNVAYVAEDVPEIEWTMFIREENFRAFHDTQEYSFLHYYSNIPQIFDCIN